jgi:glycosyltransferase involved in cell wall biosynthesis
MNLILPKISVIVPVYNVENYVSKCIESIINQNYNNLEIIIVNDGSTDKSGDICEYYSKKDDRVVLIHQENQGLSMARNNALDIVSGDYIGFVDSDDWIAPDMFDTLYKNAIEYYADISMCNFYYVHQNGKIVLNANKFGGNNIITKTVLENDDKMINYFTFIIYNVVTWNKLYKKHLFNDIRYPSKKIFEDTFTTHKLIDKANKIVAIPDHKYYYLQRNDSITQRNFNLGQLERVEASINRYNYIVAKYPNLESMCRKYIFTDLLACVYKAIMDSAIDIYRNEIKAVIEEVQKYSIYNCGLSERDEKGLILLFNDIRKYIIGIKAQNRSVH